MAENEAEVVIHAHCVLGLPDYSLIGGHLMDGTFSTVSYSFKNLKE